MQNIHDPRARISRRTFIIVGGMVATYTLLAARLWWMQKSSGEHYRLLAEKNRIDSIPVPPRRGRMLDRNGRLLAQDILSTRLVMRREGVSDPDRVINELASLLNLTDARKALIHENLRRNLPFQPVNISRSLGFEELAKVYSNIDSLDGVDFEPVLLRQYPYGASVAHVLGYTGYPSKRIASPRAGVDIFYAIGREGSEKAFDKTLEGVPGFRHMEVTAHGKPVKEIETELARAGKDLNLTIDLNLQETLYKALEGKRASAVVMDVHQGDIHACVCQPSFDNNQFVEGISREAWDTLLKDPQKPLIARAFQGVYAPGSTFKPLVALAALEEGVIRPHEEVNCTGHIQFGNRRFHCWHKHGRVDMHRALARSCDIYFYMLGQKLGINTIARYAHMLGLGELSGFPLPENKGHIPDTEWALRVRKARWNEGETLIAAIGQGAVLTTPLQLARMTAALATNTLVNTRLTMEASARTVPLGMSESHLDVVRRGMRAVVQESYGTGYYRVRSRAFEMAGKSGTSQVVSERFEDTALHLVPEQKRPHALFLGYAPYDAPRFAAAVVVENGNSGSAAAGPIVKLALETALKNEAAS